MSGIAQGTKESEGPRIELLIKGNNALPIEKRSRIDEPGRELFQRQNVAAKAAREKEFADLKEHGATLAKKIQDLLVQLCTEELKTLKSGVTFQAPKTEKWPQGCDA